jgi:acyl-CoA dehydrogenase
MSTDHGPGWTLNDWPFLEPEHHALAERVKAFNARPGQDYPDLASECRAIARDLGDAGLLDYAVPPADRPVMDVRSICVIREGLSYHHILADAVFGMQGIGTGPIQLFGTEGQKAKYLAPCREGRHVAAFALTEPDSGSDVAAMTTSARADGNGFVIEGEKVWISNAGFADHYVVVARTGEAPGSRGLSAFIVDADTPGLKIGPAIDIMAPHPAANVTFDACRVPGDALVGPPGQGFKVAMAIFDVFRGSVGAAATGVARRALDETVRRVGQRRLFGDRMGKLQGVQMTLADMAADTDVAALVTYRAAWTKDTKGGRGSYEASLAKLVATEAVGRVVDNAVQLFGALGVTQGSVIEKLYREARPMRIYEGASEVQKLVIARDLMGRLDG